MGNLLEKIVEVLKRDGVVACPTETVYGLIARANSEVAVGKIFDIKKRDKLKTLPCFVKDVESALALLRDVPEYALRLMERYWPGPLTIVGFASQSAPSACVSSEGKIGIRIPDYTFLLELLNALNEPLASTSANFSGEPPFETDVEIREKFGGLVDFVVDGKAGNIPSTVVDITGERPLITRYGKLKFSEIEQTIGMEVVFKERVKLLILLLCTGNTCRSPMAEAIFKRELADFPNIKFISRGTIHVAEKDANPIAREVLKEIGITDFKHVPRRFDELELEMADLILVMTNEHVGQIPEKFRDKVRLLGLNEEIEDPLGSGISTYRFVRDKIAFFIKAHWRPYFEWKFEK